MTESKHRSTEDLQQLADEIAREREEKGRLPFDDAPEAEQDDGTTREDHEDQPPLDQADDPTRAGAVGAASRIRGPGA